MLQGVFGKATARSADRFVKKLKPSVNVHVPDHLPMPSVSQVKKYAQRASRVNALEDQIKQLSNEQLQAKTQEFKDKIVKASEKALQNYTNAQKEYHQSTNSDDRQELAELVKKTKKQLFDAKQKVLDSILEEAFAVVREAGLRVLNMRHYDIQLVGGMALHNGDIAEMTTGEGKTLVSTLPAYLNALTGDGVHVITVNDYLAERDRHWMGPLHEFLGLSVGVILHNMDPQTRREEYAKDITYGTNNEFGFDYLRDNMVMYKEDMVQRPHHFAIIDEVDSILIDESRTPLIISGPAEESTDKYYIAHQISGQLKGRRITEAEEIDAKAKGEDLSQGYDYVADEKAKSVSLTDIGEEKAAKLFGVDNLHDMDTIAYRHHILQSLKAKEFFKRDTDYVVKEGQVIIVDEFTGRMMPGRRWSDGLHQSVEAKEGIKIERENQTLATITFQNYFRMYQKLSGMTGTAFTEAGEFKKIYDLDVLVLPTNKILQRINNPDCIYRTSKEKYEAVVEEIAEEHAKGRPVLVGTISIEKSELIGSLLTQRGIAHQVLNAKFHDLEADIIAQAGKKSAVTIATNMAGRGTDIVLGGNPEFLARRLADEKMSDEDDPTKRGELVDQFLGEFKDKCAQEHDEVINAGGLHVIGTERHESRRIDNQLRGRCGRQGDPGSSRFFVSLDDDLMRLFAGDRIKMLMQGMGFEEGQAIESSIVTGSLEIAQKRVEGHNFEIRKQLLEYDNVMNKQREVIYKLRENIIEGENTKDFVLDAIDSITNEIVIRYLPSEGEQDWDVEGLEVYLRAKFEFELGDLKDKLQQYTHEELREIFWEELNKLYAKKEQEIGLEHIRNLERMFLLHTIDTKWKDHLYAMDQLKEGVGLRALGQRDPLVEYKRESFYMFRQMYDSIYHEVAEIIFRIQPSVEEQRRRGVLESSAQETVHQDFSSLGGSAPEAAAPQAAPVARQSQPAVKKDDGTKVGRNDPCPCGSGKKYKKCCGA